MSLKRKTRSNPHQQRSGQNQLELEKPELKKPAFEKLDEQVLALIRSVVLRTGIPPSRQEIAEGLGLPNLMSAQRSVQRLKEAGKIRFGTQSKRSIEIVESEDRSKDFLELPLLGLVAAGRPIEAVEASERLQVPAHMVRGSAPHFVLKVTGESMIEDHICDGDYVVIRQQPVPNEGDRVVALIDGEATLKRFYRRQGQVELRPSNSSMKSIVVGSHQHLRIAGVYVGLIRISN